MVSRDKMRKFYRQGLLLLLFFALAAAQSLILEIPSTIYADRGSVRLGKIAKISGGDKRTRDALAALQVWTDGKTLSRKEVLRAIDDSSLSDIRLEIRMPLESRVEVPGYEGNFTDSEPARSLQDLVPVLKELAGWNGGLEISASNPVPEGRLVDPSSLVPGTSGVTLRFMDSSGRVRPLNVKLTWLQNVVIASRNIKRGDRITRENVFTRPMKINKPGRFASSPAEIIGFTSDRNIKQGEPVELSALTSSTTLKRGRPVKVIARYNGASASTDGILMEDGKPGDYVKVRRADDRRTILRGRIINENTVEVRPD